MGIEKPQSGQEAEAKCWFVRNEQGGRFGPVDFETLKAWACDGRIGPSNEISDNGSTWRVAPLQPGLDMDWVAEVTPGNFYGPIHRRAMESLIEDGAIAKQASVFMRHGSSGADSGRAPSASVSEDPEKGALRKRCLAAEARAAQAEAQMADVQRTADERLARARAEAAALEACVQESAAACTAHAQIAEQLRGDLSRQAEEARRLAEDMEARLRQLKAEAAAASAEREELRQQLGDQCAAAKRLAEEWEARLGEAQARVAAGEAERADISRRAAEQIEQSRAALAVEQQRGAELGARLESATADLASLTARLDALRGESEARERAWQEERQRLESARGALEAESRRALEETAARTARIAVLESELAQAERDARDSAEGGESEARALRDRLRALETDLRAGRERALRAEAECTELKAAVTQGAQEHRDALQRLEALSAQLADARHEIEGLRRSPAAGPVVLEAEPMDADVFAKGAKPKRERVVVEAEVLNPPDDKNAGRPPFPGSVSGRDKKAGLSLAELEQQARRELERLGAQGPAFFMKKR